MAPAMTASAAGIEAHPPASPALAVLQSPRSQVVPSAENLLKSVLAIALLLASFYGAGRVVAAIEAAGLAPILAFVLTALAVTLFAVLSGVFVTAMITLAHEAVHRVLFRSPFWNEAWGGLLSALSLVPLHANRQFHLTHHGYAHQPGRDPENAMHARSFWHAATIGSFIGLREQYGLFLANLRRAGDRKHTGRVAKDVLFVALAAGFYFALVPALGIPVTVSVLPMIAVFPLVFSFRALSDHYGLPATAVDAAPRRDILDSDRETWRAGDERRAREVSGWVVLTAPWLEWLWSHANYHEVHHKYPYLSHRYLPEVFAATRGERPYHVVRGYWRSILRARRRQYYSVSPLHGAQNS
jgi:fatty acid desaturase